MESPVRVRDALAVAFLVVVALAIGLPSYRLGIDLRDEGLLAIGAMRVLGGEIPNRDFVSLQPPLSFYLLAAVFELFSPSLEVLRTLGLCLHVLVPVAVYAAARFAASVPHALMAALPLVVMGVPTHDFAPYAVWLGCVATLTSVALLMAAVSSARGSLALAAGVMATASLASRHDQGAYLCLSVGTYLLVLARFRARLELRLGSSRLLALWSLGLVGSAVPLVLYWAFTGAVPEMFAQLVAFPLTTYADTSSLAWPRAGLGEPLAAWLVALFFGFPPVVLLLAGGWLVDAFRGRRAGLREVHACFLWILSLLFYGQVLVRTDIYHLVITLPPCFALLAWWLQVVTEQLEGRMSGARWGSGWSRALVLVPTALAGGWFLAQTHESFLDRRLGDRRPVALERAGIILPEHEAENLERVVEFLKSHADEDQSILVLPYQPMYYFLSNRRNPTRWNYLWPGDQGDEDHRELVRQAEADPPAAVVLTGRTTLESYAPAIVRYVDRKYEPAAQYRSTTFYLPRKPAP